MLVTGKGDDRHGDYPATFKYVVPLILQDAGVKYDQKTLDAIADNINLSSFQRSAANEMAKHLGAFDRKKGKRLEPAGRVKAKAKRTGIRAIDGAPEPRKDPITGEPVKKAKGREAAAKPAKEKKDPSEVKKAKLAALAKGREAAAKARAEKKAEGAGKTAEKLKKGITKPDKAPAKGKKPAVEVDPITGEPV